MRKKRRIYTLFFMLSCCMACRVSPDPGNDLTIPRETWNRDSNYKLEVHIAQPGSYVLSTRVRHSTDYNRRGLSYYLTLSHPALASIRVNADITLANDDGEWIGQGSGGLKTVVHTSDRILHLDSAGTYTVEIGHRMKEKELKGIKNIGIKLSSYHAHGEK